MVVSDTDYLHLVYSRCCYSSNRVVTAGLVVEPYCSSLHHSNDANFVSLVYCMSDKRPEHRPFLGTYQVEQILQESSG